VKRLYIPLLVLALVSLACASLSSKETSTPEAAPTLPTSPEIVSQVVMCREINEETFDPVGLTVVFEPTVTIHAVVNIQNAPPNTKIEINWLVTDNGGTSTPNYQMGTYSQTVEGTRNIDFTFKPTNDLPAGAYRVEIMMNGKLVKTVPFYIQSVE
jgi:hypothetical protein